MIIVVTLFVIFCVMLVISITGLVASVITADTESASGFLWQTLIVALFASIPAQYIWGGGL